MRRFFVGLEVEAARQRWLWGNLLVFAPLAAVLVVVDRAARGYVPVGDAPALVWGGLLAAWALPGVLLAVWAVAFSACAVVRVTLDVAWLQALGRRPASAGGWLVALLAFLAIGDWLTAAPPQAVDSWLLGVPAVVGMLFAGRFYLLLLVSALTPAWASRSARSAMDPGPSS